MSGLILSRASRARISAGSRWKAFARLLDSFFRFWANDMWKSQKSFLRSAEMRGWSKTRILMTAESTLGCGSKAVEGTGQTIDGSPKRWT